jgi:hypothetical protein
MVFPLRLHFIFLRLKYVIKTCVAYLQQCLLVAHVTHLNRPRHFSWHNEITKISQNIQYVNLNCICFLQTCLCGMPTMTVRPHFLISLPSEVGRLLTPSSTWETTLCAALMWILTMPPPGVDKPPYVYMSSCYRQLLQTIGRALSCDVDKWLLSIADMYTDCGAPWCVCLTTIIINY